MEGAGEVVAVGPDVARLAKGDRVAWCISWGAYADYAVVPERLLAKVPDAFGLDQAAASIFQGSTAHYLVNDVARLEPGSTCLIHAASGIIGQILVQMAKRRGATVFTTGSSEAKCDVARGLGADHAMVYEGFAGRIRAATAGRGVDVVFDAVGKATLRESFRATRKRGIVVNYGNVSGSMKDLDPYELGEAGSLFLTRPRLNDHLADAATVQRRADDIFSALIDATLRVPIVARYKLEDVEQAHERIEGRAQVGKAVVEI
jgi:NADPH2:quinone reductase